ncbi:MAG: hypothetical protein Q8Q60_02280 [Candidatus Chromulinivorax sp.]|nr:hypothetical protein [Candidatus Chromulinivorax sp.]
MKMIKNILLCVIAVIAQDNFCRADAQQQDDDKKIQIIEDQQPNEAVESDKVVENAPYITKSTMLTIAAGMLVVVVGWRFFADYYGVFPFCLGDVVPRPNQPSNNDGNNDDNNESSALQNSDQFIAQSMSEPVVTNDQEDAWGAQYEREADNERAERQARKEAGVEPHFLNQMVTAWRFKVYQDGLTKFEEKNYPSYENDASDASDVSSDVSDDSMPELEECPEYNNSYDSQSHAAAQDDVNRWASDIADVDKQLLVGSKKAQISHPVRFLDLSSVDEVSSLQQTGIDSTVNQAAELRAKSAQLAAETAARRIEFVREQALSVGSVVLDQDEVQQLCNKIAELTDLEDEIQRLKEQQEQD